MSTLPILSIILPVYNGEAFIRKAIQSVLNQNMQEWELLVVNDGSVDASESIISELCDQDPRIIKITQDNKGLSAARNAGFNRASGKYIVYLDVDDYVESDYYSRMIECAEEYQSDFIVSSYIREFVQADGYVKSKNIRFKEQLLNQIEQIRTYSQEMNFYNVYIHVWNKIYRHDFLKQHDIIFDESHRYAEDVPYNIAVLEHAKSILFCDIPGYHYVCHHAERLTTKWKESLLADNCQVYQQIVDFEKEYLNVGNSEVAAGMYLRSCFLTIEKAISLEMSYPDVKEIINSLFMKQALENSLFALEHSCSSKEFLIYKFILQIKNPGLFYMAVILRKYLKQLLGR